MSKVCILSDNGEIGAFQLLRTDNDKAIALTRTLVKHVLLYPGTNQAHAYIIKGYVVHLAFLITADKTAVLRVSKDIDEADTAHLTALAFYLALGESPVGILMVAVGTRIAGDIDRLGLSPPHIAPQATVHLDIREDHIRHSSLVTILDAQTAVRACDDAVVEDHIIDRVYILTSNLDGTRTAGHHAVGDGDIVAGAIALCLTTVLQTDTVIARGDMAVGDAHILRVVEVDAITITDLQVVEQVDALDDGLVATHEMYGPVGTLLDGHITDGEVTHIRQRQHMGTGVEGLVCQRLQLIAVAQLCSHEGDAIAVDGALACNADVLGIVGPEPEHTLTSIFSKGTQAVDALIGIGFQRGCGFKIQLHVALQLDGTCQERMIAWQQHSAAAFSGTTVNHLLDGLGIVGLTITFCSGNSHIVDLLGS